MPRSRFVSRLHTVCAAPRTQSVRHEPLRMSVFRDTTELRTRGYDPSSIEEAREWNVHWEAFLASPIGPFLTTGDPQELWNRPGTPMLDMEIIARDAQE